MWLRTAALIALPIAAACLGGHARAQTAFQFPDPLAPKLQTDPSKAQTFKKVTTPSKAQFGPPTNFAPASGAGKTGFDSTNARKKTAGKRKPAGTAASTDSKTIAPGLAAPLTISPSSPAQKPANNAFAQAPAAPPGSPPVEIGPIRKLPPKRKAHSEPPDEYA